MVDPRSEVEVKSPATSWRRSSFRGVTKSVDSEAELVHFYQGHTALEDLSRPTNLVCITLYNERIAEFVSTLRSMLKCLRAFDRSFSGMGLRSCLFVVADGDVKLDRRIKEFLVRSELLPTAAQAPILETSLYFSCHAGSALLSALGEGARDDAWEQDAGIGVVCCIKPENRGKLHSHAIFFDYLCRLLSPHYCFQIDVGTVVDSRAVCAMYEHMQAQPRVGALASRMLSGTPTPNDHILKVWQFLEFCNQTAFAWPGEVLAGHLSVLAGQFCVLRWSAITNEVAERGNATGSADPLARYLRGLHPRSVLERLMFLAEDRVIGSEITMAPEVDWRIDFCIESCATTDPCSSVQELLRQRRRWNNSSIACRLWMLRQWRSQLLRTDRGLASKLRYSTAMLWQIIIAVQQFVCPAVAVCIWATPTLVLWRRAPWQLPMLLMILTFTSITLFFQSDPRARPGRYSAVLPIVRDVFTNGLFLSVAASMFLYSQWQVILLILGPSLLMLIHMVIVLRPHGWTIARRYFEYIAFNPVLQTATWGYAFFRLNDLSWGTKGLTQTPSELRSARKSAWIRNVVFSTWIAVNLGVVLLSMLIPARLSSAVNCVAEASSVFTLAVTFPVGVVYFLLRRSASFARRTEAGASRAW